VTGISIPKEFQSITLLEGDDIASSRVENAEEFSRSVAGPMNRRA